MKKLLLWGGLPIAIVLLGLMIWCIASEQSTDFINTDNWPEYGIGGQQNKLKSGSVIYWSLTHNDELYLFVNDYKRRPKRPLYLCYMNYTSTQGSYDAKWSKDGQMMAVYNQSSESGYGAPWVIGYDWKTGKVLQSKEILHAFSLHKGVGVECELKTLRDPTAEEIKQYKPKRLHR